jgi:tRNA-2-methylthio-N6-dimethylallyladenosine synthase
MNEADSEKLAAVFEKKGYKLTPKINEANFIIINTCSVRESAENRVFGLIHNLIRHPSSVIRHPKIILTGCMVGSARGERRRYTLLELKRKLPRVDEFLTLQELIGQDEVTPKRKKKTSAFVPIMEGCDNFCTYCVVPYARGREQSRPFNEIVCEVKELARRGYKEITLLGQNVNSYGKTLKLKRTFAELLTRVHQINGIKKISFLTSNPWDLTDDIVDAMTLPKIDKTLHLPVQSGDDQILKKMNRPYTANEYLELINKIKNKIPNIKFTTDIIVGFPAETKEAFKDTVKLCKKVGFVKAYIARYSSRPGTAAHHLKDDIPPEEKKRRWQILDKLINQKS